MSNDDRQEPTWLSRVLSVFADVRANEAAVVLTLLGNLFLILVAYYIIKTVREPLILADGGAEVKSYAAAGQAALLVVLVPVYSWFASRVDRMRLIWGVTLFLVACIEAFYFAAKLEVPYLGVIFFIWVGIFNLAIIAQFWSFANDLYTRAQGERVFPAVAIGATVGGVVGARIASELFTLGVGAYEMLQVAAVILLVHGGVYSWVNTRTTRDAPPGAAAAEAPLGRGDGFTLVLRSPYLRMLAVLLILLNIVNTTGEYILGATVEAAAHAAVAADPSVTFEAFVGSFYGDFFFWVNIGTVVVQALVVSRLVRFFGIAGVLFALPIVALGAYGLVAAGAGLAVLRWAKTAENLTDYSVMNTARAMLWLPTTRSEKYKAKQAIDTFFVRLGDVVSAMVVFVGTSMLGLGLQSFAAFNILVIGAWLVVAWLVWRMYTAAAEQEAE